MTKKECRALAEIALVGFLTRNFFGRKYESAEFRRILEGEMIRFDGLLNTFDGLGAMLLCLTLAENDRKAFDARLNKLDREQMMQDVIDHCVVVMRGLEQYDMVFPLFYALTDERAERRAKKREAQSDIG